MPEEFYSKDFPKLETEGFFRTSEPAAYNCIAYVERHAARQQANGKWRSKLGPHEDIETTLEGLVGPCYGKVISFLKRAEGSQPSIAAPDQ